MAQTLRVIVILTAIVCGGGLGEHRGVRIMEHSKGNDLINHPTAWKTLTRFALNDPDKTVIPGTVVTKPFKLADDKLQVNVDAGDGQVRVEILDEDGKPIPGFSDNNASTYKGVDQLRLAPRWNDDVDLSSLVGKVVRLRFHLKNAKLYSFQIHY